MTEVVLVIAYVLIGGGIGFFFPYLFPLLKGEQTPRIASLRRRTETWVYCLFDGFLWLSCLFFVPTESSAVYAGICSVLLLIAICDLEEKIVPDRLIWILLVLAGICFFVADGSPADRVWGGITAGGVFLLLYLGSRVVFRWEAIGLGDVKLMAVLGLILGMGGVFWTFILSVVLAAGVILTESCFGAVTGKDRNGEWAFAPYLALGSIIVMLFADEIVGDIVQLIVNSLS